MSESEKVRAEKFSAGYDVIYGVDVIDYNGEEAIIDENLFQVLERAYGQDFIARIGDSNYILKPRRSILEDTVAIPADSYDGSDSFLVKR